MSTRRGLKAWGVLLVALSLLIVTTTLLATRQEGSLFFLNSDLTEVGSDLLEEEKLAEAALISHFIIQRPDLGSQAEAEAILNQSNAQNSNRWRRTQRLLEGAITGEARDLESLAGAVALDLFLLGDLRDLAIQGWRSINGEETDSLILTLATLGVLTSPTFQLDLAPAMVKALRRSGAFSASLSKELGGLIVQLIKKGAAPKLTQAMDDIGELTRHFGFGPLSALLKNIDSTTALHRLTQASASNPAGTYTLIHLFGRRGVDQLVVDGNRTGHTLNRIRKNRRFSRTLYKTAHRLPLWSLFTALLIAITGVIKSLFLFLALIRRIRRTARLKRQMRYEKHQIMCDAFKITKTRLRQ